MLEIDVSRGEKVILRRKISQIDQRVEAHFCARALLWLTSFRDDQARFLTEGCSVRGGVGPGGV